MGQPRGVQARRPQRSGLRALAWVLQSYRLQVLVMLSRLGLGARWPMLQHMPLTSRMLTAGMRTVW